MSYTRKSLADYLDGYDAEISALQDSKRDMMQDYRAQLAEKGFVKTQIKAEIDALKSAMRRRRAIAKTSETEVEQADALADEIFIEITGPAPRATPARENIEQFPPHNPETGELTDTQEQPVEPATQSGPASPRSNPSLAARGADESAAPHFPSAAPPADTVALEPQAPRPDATVPLSIPQEPNSSPAADSPASTSSPEPGSLSEKKGCLKLKDGHCKISFDTPALCSVCNAERMKARAA